MKNILLVLCGAVAGGILGYLAFGWMVRQGYYALILPGGLLGLGAGFARQRSLAVAVVCSVAATALGLFTEWRFFPFKEDESLRFFLLHAYQLEVVTLAMIVLGGLIGFWVPYRRIERA